MRNLVKTQCKKIIVWYEKFYYCNYLLVPAPPPLGRLWWGCPRSSIQRPLWLVFVLFFDALSGWHPRWGTRRATSVAFMLRHTTTTDLQKKGYISLQNYNSDKDFIVLFLFLFIAIQFCKFDNFKIGWFFWIYRPTAFPYSPTCGIIYMDLHMLPWILRGGGGRRVSLDL